MVNTGNNVFLFQTVDSLGDHRLMSILYLSRQLLRSQHLELPFHHAERMLDRIQLGTIWDIIYIAEVQISHGLLGPLAGMC